MGGIRKHIFFLKDRFLNHAVIQRHLEDIKNNYYAFHDEINEKEREKKLKNLLDYTCQHVPYYKNSGFKKWADFPVVNKAIIKENYEKFISDKFDIRQLSYVTTSGSTGTPFKSYRDNAKIARHTADNIFFNQIAGGDIGFKLYYFRVWNSINTKSRLKKLMQNIEEIDANDFSEQFIRQLIQKMEKDRTDKFLLSYASSYEALSQITRALGIEKVDGNIACLISMSESLPQGTREYLETFFGAPVVSRYSNMENGFIGQQCLENKSEYHINGGSYHVEILAFDEDKPVSDGELGRIVVTDFYNYAMPFIRYDTGDAGVKNTSLCRVKGPVLSRVEGRRTDFIFSTSGRILSPHIITNTMWKFPDILQFQFIQKGEKQYILKLNSPIDINQDILKSEFQSFLGVDAEIRIEFVNEIPLLSSGKRKKIVNEYKLS